MYLLTYDLNKDDTPCILKRKTNEHLTRKIMRKGMEQKWWAAHASLAANLGIRFSRYPADEASDCIRLQGGEAVLPEKRGVSAHHIHDPQALRIRAR